MPELTPFEQHAADNGVFLYPIRVPRFDKVGEALEDLADAMHAHLPEEDDCYCASDKVAKGTCSICLMRKAYRRVRQLLYPEFRPIQPERLGRGIRERVFVEKWQKANQRSGAINGGRGILELILEPLRQRRGGGRPLGWESPKDRRYVPPISQRDADVSTAVIQWLGTNCGQAFLWECARLTNEAVKLDREESEWFWIAQDLGVPRDPAVEHLDAVLEHARTMASYHFQSGTKQYEKLVRSFVAFAKTIQEMKPDAHHCHAAENP